MMIELEINVSDGEEIVLAHRSWAIIEDGYFAEKISSILPFRDITHSSQLTRFIEELDVGSVVAEIFGAFPQLKDSAKTGK